MPAAVCTRCGLRPAALRLSSAGGEAAVCPNCFDTQARAWGFAPAVSLAQFALTLFDQGDAPFPSVIGEIDFSAACPQCGLKYEELAADGRPGCESCYRAFEAAILPALNALASGSANAPRASAPNPRCPNSPPARGASRAEIPIPPPAWLEGGGCDDDAVVATRCRAARNLQGLPFPWRSSAGQLREARLRALDAAGRCASLSDALLIAADSLDADEAARLVAWRYASLDWVCGGGQRALLIGRDRALSLMVNEEDHLRFQSVLPGLGVESAYQRVWNAAREFESNTSLCRSGSVGWLTASLVNAGAGLRISVLLHLPALALGGRLPDALNAAALLGCSVRGAYGEGTPGTGSLYQLSNSCSFRSEPRDICRATESAAAYLVEQERLARTALFGTEAGRAGLAALSEAALRRLFREDLSPRYLLEACSMLRLAAAEGLASVSVGAASAWIAAAGAEAFLPGDTAQERFEAGRRTAALRVSIRDAVERSGTLDQPKLG